MRSGGRAEPLTLRVHTLVFDGRPKACCRVNHLLRNCCHDCLEQLEIVVMAEDERAATRERIEKDREDFNNEIAGRETGRAARFVPDYARPEAEKARREEREQFRGLIAITLQGKLDELRQRLEELDRLTILALREAERRLEASEIRIAQMRKDATLDAFGRIVYRTGDGTRAFYEDGRELTSEEREGVSWRDSAPSWEERCELAREREHISRDIDRIGVLRDRLGTVRDQLHSDGELTADELRSLEDDTREASSLIAPYLPMAADELDSEAPASSALTPSSPRPR